MAQGSAPSPTKALGTTWEGVRERRVRGCEREFTFVPKKVRERDFSIDNLLVRVHFIIVMIRWTGLSPWRLRKARNWLPVRSNLASLLSPEKTCCGFSGSGAVFVKRVR